MCSFLLSWGKHLLHMEIQNEAEILLENDLVINTQSLK